jgi:hypothetical protein
MNEPSEGMNALNGPRTTRHEAQKGLLSEDPSTLHPPRSLRILRVAGYSAYCRAVLSEKAGSACQKPHSIRVIACLFVNQGWLSDGWARDVPKGVFSPGQLSQSQSRD